MRVLHICGVVLAAMLAWVASALPAFGADSGTVPVQVTVAAPCITVEPTAGVDFGTLAFSTSSFLNNRQAFDVGFTNCSGTNTKVTVRGTNATGTTATWTLGSLPGGNIPNRCASSPAPLNVYELTYVIYDASTATTFWGVNSISNIDQFLRESSAPGEYNGSPGVFPDGFNGPSGATPDFGSEFRIFMPCTGSDGAAETMSLDVVFTATL